CIIGIFLMLGLAFLVGGLMRVSDVFFNMSRPTESEREKQAVTQKTNSAFVGGVLIAFFIYIAILVVTFAVRTKTKAVGIIIIILGLMGMATTNLWGIIPFALLLPAGISALRYKRELTKPSS